MSQVTIRTILCVIAGYLSVGQIVAQKLATITVESGSYQRMDGIASAQIDGLPLAVETNNLVVKEVVAGRQVEVPSQLEGGQVTLLWLVMPGVTMPNEIRNFELWQEPKRDAGRRLAIEDNGQSLVVNAQNRPMMAYQYKKASVPEGVSDIYSRAGFIHPLWSPGGAVLTRIQPPDHYHHYGIWNPWTHTEFEGKEVDFWNLNKGQGTVEVTGKPIKYVGDLFANISARHTHMVSPDSTNPLYRPALDELFNLRTWNTASEITMGMTDVVSSFSCASESSLTLKEYRYQGFGFRARENWNDTNTTLITSEGFNKENGNATRARWCQVTGPTENGQSGILFLTHPANFNFPELLRIWPTGANQGKENIFVNFNPTQDRDWILQPGQSYALKYRMVTYDGTMDIEKAEQLWNDYAHPPKVTVSPTYSFYGKKILVFTKNGEGYVHDNIASSVKALKKLGLEQGFQVMATDSSSVFTSPDLHTYDAVIFSNTNNKVFDTQKEKVAFQKYIRSGKGFVGIHVASGTSRDWPWFAKMLGGRFVRHPVLQKFDVEVIDRNHPSTNFLPEKWSREDECYFLNHLNPANHVLLAVNISAVIDEKKKDFPGETFGEYCPVAWCHTFDGGKQWYTALGHKIEHYQDPMFLRHILGGIEWVTSN